MKTAASSAVSGDRWLADIGGGAYGGESRAENAGIRLLIVHPLSGVGSCCVVRESYA